MWKSHWKFLICDKWTRYLNFKWPVDLSGWPSSAAIWSSGRDIQPCFWYSYFKVRAFCVCCLGVGRGGGLDCPAGWIVFLRKSMQPQGCRCFHRKVCQNPYPFQAQDCHLQGHQELLILFQGTVGRCELHFLILKVCLGLHVYHLCVCLSVCVCKSVSWTTWATGFMQSVNSASICGMFWVQNCFLISNQVPHPTHPAVCYHCELTFFLAVWRPCWLTAKWRVLAG